MSDNNLLEDEVEYLYHYTSVESLALILKNHTIRLNALNKMDDLQEQKTQDIENFGQFFFVSSWTDEKDESIPMWKMYTNISAGVRIKLRKNPFKRQSTDINELKALVKRMPIEYEVEDDRPNTLLNIAELVKQKVYSADAVHGNILHKVQYTNQKSLLEPQVFEKSNEGYSFSYGIMGRYKNLHWSFQKEWRYLMSYIPLDLSGTTEDAYMQMVKTAQRIVKGTETLPFSFVDLEIANEFFEEMEITPSPRMSAGYRIALECLIEKYNPKATVKESNLIGLI